jgi:heat shock protein HslJ
MTHDTEHDAAAHLPPQVAAALVATWQTTPTGAVPLSDVLADGRRRARRGRRAMTLASLGVAASIVVAATYNALPQGDVDVGKDTGRVTVSPSPDPLPVGLTGRMFVQERPYSPGETLEIRWPGEEVRGVGYSFDRWNGMVWEPTFYLRSGSPGAPRGMEPAWWPVEGSGTWGDVGLGGPGPDIAVVPDTAKGGTYRLCTANSQAQSCAIVEIEASSSQDQSAESEPEASASASLDGRWRVIGLVGPLGNSILTGPYADAVEMTFSDGTMTGKSGCNGISGNYVLSGRDITFDVDSLISTTAGCEEPPLLDRLLDVRHVSRVGDDRYLHAANWMIVMVLRR